MKHQCPNCGCQFADATLSEKPNNGEHETARPSADSVDLHRVGRLHEYKLHWKGGDEEIVTGTDIADAVNKRGYGGGAMAALDYWSEVQANDGFSDGEPKTS